MIYCNLKNYLKLEGKSAYWLAKETGITYQTILDFVNNRKIGIQYDTLDKICNALNCIPGDILKKKNPL